MSGRLKIVVYTITKDEEKFIARYCDSAAAADEIVIVDTGSTDRTVEVAKECGATVHSIFVSPWRFDVARNASLALLPSDADICVALDADEVLVGGWREEVEALWKRDTTRMRYLFDWGRDVRFMSDKIHSRRGYTWRHPCHERLVPDPRTNEKFVQTESLLVLHLPDDNKSRGQYLGLLEVGVKEDPHDSRNSFYYARELTFHARWEEAIVELKRYLALPAATWPAERALAMRSVGLCLTKLGRAAESEEWYVKATLEAPDRRESWVDLADFYRRAERWGECLVAAERAVATTGNKTAWPHEPTAWKEKPYDILALAAYYTGDKDKALRNGRIASELSPGNTRLLDNLKWYL